ncbi:hypothetical protein [Propionispora vibrioides]|uniref:Uncharacterized protein n=1 Tax=Propionispora vibrioides TaxID=112903 RepID=A0A1H8R2R6_9FIRM|nr:hypothetical protein [Propionispora vibrioides]SEO60193.1 hypothetical protein SAMN04490178_103130 [Propionispora vibrioides]
MRKLFLLIVMLFMVVAVAPAATAAPAAPLSKTIIEAVGMDSGGNWIERQGTSPAILNQNNPIVGNTIYLQVHYVGILGSEVIYQSGKAIPKQYYKITNTKYINGPGGIMAGEIVIYAIQKNGLPGPKTGNIGQIYVDAKGINSGSAYDFVNNLYLK